MYCGPIKIGREPNLNKVKLGEKVKENLRTCRESLKFFPFFEVNSIEPG